MHRLGDGPVRRAVAALAVGAVVAVAAAGCAFGQPDAVDEDAVGRLTLVLDVELAGREISTREGFEALVRGAHPAVAAGLDGMFAPGDLEYAVYRGSGQSLPSSAPVAVAVWYRAFGGGPFVDDGGAWHLTCAELSVDRAAASVRGTVVPCPGRVLGEPPTVLPDAPAPLLRHVAPADGALLTGDPAATGAAAGVLRAATPAAGRYPCASDELAGAVEALSTTIGSTDAATVRVVNTSGSACVLRGPVRLGLRQGGEDLDVVAQGPAGAPVVLAPRESAVASVTWQPSEQVDRLVPQQLTLGPDAVPLRVGAGLPVAPVPVDGGATLRIGPWRLLGYGAPPDDAPRAVDVAAPCVGDDLGVTTTEPTGGSGATARPSVDVLNLGAVACSVRPSAPGGIGVDGLPALREAPLVVLRPGDRVSLLTEVAVTPRPGELRVAGEWVPFTSAPAS